MKLLWSKKMKRIFSEKELEWYTPLRKILLDLELADKDYFWLISDFEAYPENEKAKNLLYCVYS